MSWETEWEDIWACPKCSKEVTIRFRMDDWNRREYVYDEKDGKISSSFTDPSPAYCETCGIEMELKESN